MDHMIFTVVTDHEHWAVRKTHDLKISNQCDTIFKSVFQIAGNSFVSRSLFPMSEFILTCHAHMVELRDSFQTFRDFSRHFVNFFAGHFQDISGHFQTCSCNFFDQSGSKSISWAVRAGDRPQFSPELWKRQWYDRDFSRHFRTFQDFAGPASPASKNARSSNEPRRVFVWNYFTAAMYEELVR